MSKKKKHSSPAVPTAEPAKAERTQPEEPAVSSTARWMGALCYLSILILIPACTKWRQDEFVRFHLNQGLMVLMLATICAALGFVPVLEQVALSLTLLVDVLSLVGLITALRRRAAPLPFVGLLVARFHPFCFSLYILFCIIQIVLFAKHLIVFVYLFYIIRIVLSRKGVFYMSKAVIFFAPGLEECEGLLSVDLLRRSGVEVTIAAVGGEKIVKSARSISVVADALAEELDYSAFDAAILPGGIPGVDNLKADATVRKVCTEFAAAGKVVAAICAAPSVLAAFGILQGKKATVYPGMEDKLTAAGAEYTGLPITLDGSIITGEALGAAIPFALALASRLAGQQASNAVKQGIVYRY